MPIENPSLRAHAFLAEMAADSYFPKELVEKGSEILVRLCQAIESTKPNSLEALYSLAHLATEEFNQLATEFEENGSEVETVARECIGAEFRLIASSYGFDADPEELIAPRDW